MTELPQAGTPTAGVQSTLSARWAAIRPRIIDRAFAAGWSVLPRVPERVAGAAFDAVGTVSAMWPGAYAQLRANLREVVGPSYSAKQLDALTRRSVRSYTRYWREVFQLPGMDPADVGRRTEYLGGEHVDRAMHGGRGVVIALTHSGNWDAAAVQLCQVRGYAMTSVAERLKPESLYERFKRFRESLGMTVVPLTGGPEPSVVALKRALNEGQQVTLLADRDLQANGIPVQLCGRRTTMPTGPGLMALQTGSALLPLELGYTETGWRMRFHPEIEMPTDGRLRERVTHGMTALAEIFTDVIRRNPQDWHMLQKIWPDV